MDEPTRTAAVENHDAAALPGLRGISAVQWRSGAAAWLGWLFDGLDMHLYTVVAAPFVAQLLDVANPFHPDVSYYSSIIQGAFLVGWALGGGLFGRIGDRLGRSRALVLTILTYAGFTGLGFFAQTWWQLLVFRFLAALGIGGEWAVGASLLAETWPKRWRPWIAAVLQSAVNCGILLAMVAIALLSLFPYDAAGYYRYRVVFLVGVLPALLVLWIRRAVPEPETWREAKRQAGRDQPRLGDLFRRGVRRTTLVVVAVCGLSLAGHWAFMFWCMQHLRGLPEVARWDDAEKTRLQTTAMVLLMVTSIAGNFLAGAAARRLGYRRTIACGCLLYFAAMFAAYCVPRGHVELFAWMAALGGCSGLFALFTMCLPPLFPTLLRTTGAGFGYNIGRLAAAAATVMLGLLGAPGDPRWALVYTSFLFLPAAAFAMLLSEPPDQVPSQKEGSSA